MAKIRKNFVLDKRTVNASERVAKKNKRSLTAHIEFLMYNDAVNNGEYFKTDKK